MSKIKPQIKKNNSANLITALGGMFLVRLGLIGEIVFKLFDRNKKDKKK
ncbi:hypothetical protein ATCC49503_05800 [Helicobacter pylori]|nr:hypothetical protein ATCC49503_05800 [Helicobacter pylori]